MLTLFWVRRAPCGQTDRSFFASTHRAIGTQEALVELRWSSPGPIGESRNAPKPSNPAVCMCTCVRVVGVYVYMRVCFTGPE